MELPRDGRRRLPGAEDHPLVGGGERAAGDPGAGQNLQTGIAGGIF